MIGVAIMGCGTVGSGVCRVLRDNADDISRRLGDDVVIRKILELRRELPLELGFAEDLVTSDIPAILDDTEIQIVIETMGGTGVALDFILQCMKQGKHIVTSNKDLVEMHWDALFACAGDNGVDFYFEAAVCGGIPVIGSIKTSLAANRFESIVGILNGTTNYILTRMAQDGLDYNEALRLAQDNGFAELDPASDVEGTDAARKLSILARLAFNSNLKLNEVYKQGITGIKVEDIKVATRLGYTIKLIACATSGPEGISAYVRPAFVANTHPIASVLDEYNAVFLHGNAVDDVMLYGKGAGSLPTASSVVGDVITVGRNMLRSKSSRTTSFCYADKPVIPASELSNKFYVRLSVLDRPMVLASVASAFGRQAVNLESLIQTPAPVGFASLVLLTHPTTEQSIRLALESFEGNDDILHASTMICID